MEKKTLIANLIFYSLIAIVILGMIYIVILLKGSGSECLKNPFTYGAKNSVGLSGTGEDKSSQNPDVSCSCSVYGEGSISNFCFNNTDVRQGTCYDYSEKSDQILFNVSK